MKERPTACLHRSTNPNSAPSLSCTPHCSFFFPLLIKQGSFNQSAYFIGSYMAPYEKNDPAEPKSRYNVGVAYIAVTGISLILIFMLTLYSVALNIYRGASSLDDGQHPISEIVFASYDHLLMDPRSVKVKQLNVAQQLLAQVFEQKSKEEYAQKNKWSLFWRRVLVNVAVLMTLALSFWAIQVTVDNYASDSSGSIKQLVPSIAVSLLNQAVPIMFEMMSRFEQWRTPLETIRWTVVRSLVLRIGSLYAFFYTYFVVRDEFMVSAAEQGRGRVEGGENRNQRRERKEGSWEMNEGKERRRKRARKRRKGSGREGKGRKDGKRWKKRKER